MSEQWTHGTVYAALRDRPGCYGSDPQGNSYAYLYPQRLRKNTAALYAPDSTKYADFPLHIKPDGPDPRPELFEALEPFVCYRRQADRFDAYEVTDWNGVAHVLGLRATPS